MRFGSLALVLALSQSLVACGGGGTDDTVSGVFPSSAFTGRKVRVEISGDATNWKDGTTVDFGPGVMVQSVAVASPTALFAEITVSHDVAPGLRDVTVTSGGDKLVLKEAFLLESPLSMKFQGTLAQGSIAFYTINNRDFDTPFDTTSTGDGFFTPLEYTNTTIEASPGSEYFIEQMTPYSIAGQVVIDIDAAPGQLTVSSGLDEDLVKSSLGQNVNVATRTPTPLVAGMPASITVTEEFASSLFEISATAGSVATLRASGAGSTVIVLGPSGKFSEFVSQGADNAIIMPAAAKLHAVFINGQGMTGTFSVVGNVHNLTAVTEAEPGNNTATAAATVSKTALVTASLAAADDQDWFAIDVTAADVGKRIHMRTGGSDPQTDPVVQAFTGVNGATAFGTASSDRGYHEYHKSPAITAAGKYWVKVTASTEFDPSHKSYSLAIWIE